LPKEDLLDYFYHGLKPVAIEPVAIEPVVIEPVVIEPLILLNQPKKEF
jgi:hypothetical protein